MMEPKWFWILLTVLFAGGWFETEGCLEHERVALLHLKSFFNDPYGYLTDWKDVKGSNCCEWQRVNCSVTSRRVMQLSLNHTRGQYGYLNASLFLPFTELKTLYLMGNHISGFVNNQGFGKVASALRKLEILDLSENYLNDSILTSLSELSSLESLYLAYNKFTGSDDTNGFAKLCSALKNLVVLDLSHNYFNGTILTSLSELSSLKSLYLAGNKFTGSEQANGFKWLSRLSNLETLDLNFNKLKNSFLLHVGGLSSLETLNLAYNQFKGSVNMTELNRMRKLRNLDLSFNAIESFMSFHDNGRQQMMNLEELDLSDNLLQNISFVFISGLSNLKNLYIGFNKLQGSIDIKGWCDLWNLEELKLGGNSLEGSIPSCFHNLTSLRLLDISNNHIEVLPSFISLANNSGLKFLWVDQNHLVRDPTFQTQTINPKFQLKLLSMSNCSTKGLIPKELPNFLYEQYELRYVDLSYNNFGGENPAWLLENNTRLQQFLLAGNSFKGLLQLPKQANVDMFEVDMSGNKLQGQIPLNICSTFPYLWGLYLSQNAFEGNIPSCLGGLESLHELDLSYNNFSGGILEELAKSNSMWILRLSNNSLSGNIPPALFSSRMDGLYLDGNNFDGEIPLIDTSNVTFYDLRIIDLSNNHLSGKLPRWIWNLSGLQTLDFSNNHFDADHIPLELCNLVWLTFLDLSQNNFSGSVPSCFSSLTRLKHLHLSRNRLSGPLPVALHNSSSLVTSDLSQNNLTGKIPYWISTLSALRILLLKANHFEGKIPSQICRLNSLSIIDLSQNKLFGHIPSCLSNLTLEPTDTKSFLTGGHFPFFINSFENVKLGFGWEHFYPDSYAEEQVSFTTKKGLYTYSGNVLKYMSGIDLSCNRLTGKIPSEIGKLSELRSLNLSHNNLIGFIPSTFSNLKQVESLDLSYNKLSGTIPVQLMELNSLEVFNVSYNNLSGGIPYEKAQFATFDESSYLGNPFLCGPPKHESCTKTPNASDSEEESGFLDMHVFYVTFVVCYTIVVMTFGVVLYLNPYWRRAWLYFIQQCIDNCYYFILDNVLGFSLFRRRS